MEKSWARLLVCLISSYELIALADRGDAKVRPGAENTRLPDVSASIHVLARSHYCLLELLKRGLAARNDDGRRAVACRCWMVGKR